jgi:hypothetical protein
MNFLKRQDGKLNGRYSQIERKKTEVKCLSAINHDQKNEEKELVRSKSEAKTPPKIPRPTIAQQAPGRLLHSGIASVPPKALFRAAWKFRQRFEQRELRLAPSSACSYLAFITCCGRSFRGV